MGTLHTFKFLFGPGVSQSSISYRPKPLELRSRDDNDPKSVLGVQNDGTMVDLLGKNLKSRFMLTVSRKK